MQRLRRGSLECKPFLQAGAAEGVEAVEEGEGLEEYFCTYLHAMALAMGENAGTTVWGLLCKRTEQFSSLPKSIWLDLRASAIV